MINPFLFACALPDFCPVISYSKTEMTIKDGYAEIWIVGTIGTMPGQVSADRFMEELRQAEAQRSEVRVRMHTRGGDVAEGIAIFNAIKNSPVRVDIYIDGLAASMGAVIAMAGSQIKMSRFARMMTHCASGVAGGGAGDLRRTADLLDSLNKTMAEMIATRAGITAKEATTRYLKAGVDTWLTARQALDAHLIDQIYDGPIKEDYFKDINSINTPQAFDALDMKICARLTGGDKPKNNMEYTIVAQSLGLGNDATAQQIQAAVTEKIQALATAEARATAAEAQAAEMKAELEKFRAQAKAAADAARTQLAGQLEAAQRDGRISAQLRAELQALGESDPTRAAGILAQMQPHAPLPKEQTAAKYEGKTWDELDKAGKLADYKADDPEGFKALYKERFGTDYAG